MKASYLYVALAVIAGFVLGRLTARPEVRTEVVTEYRPILTSIAAPSSISQPVGSRVEKVKLVFVREDNFPITDVAINVQQPTDHLVTTLEEADSATVELPLRDYTFSDDSTYTIIARGAYVESLPTIEFTPRTITTTRTEIARAPRITHGIQLGGGVAYTPKGLQPAIYIGYGLNIRF